MAVVTNSKRADGIVNVLTGSYTGDGAAQIITLGFNPLYVLLVNETDGITHEKIDPMVAANTLKTAAAGTRTIDAGSAILFNGDNTITISATASITAKAFKFMARR